MTRPAALTLLLGLLLAFRVGAEAADPWTTLGSLVGEWTGEGTGDPGAGSGRFTFERALADKVFIRKNIADYPATKERPAFRHEDLMVVYREGPKVRADTWDNEGHRIRYEVTVAEGHLVFLSEPGTGPRFRLTYGLVKKDAMDITFEIAPPGTPDAWKRYISAKVLRTGPL